MSHFNCPDVSYFQAKFGLVGKELKQAKLFQINRNYHVLISPLRGSLATVTDFFASNPPSLLIKEVTAEVYLKPWLMDIFFYGLFPVKTLIPERRVNS